MIGAYCEHVGSSFGVEGEKIARLGDHSSQTPTLPAHSCVVVSIFMLLGLHPVRHSRLGSRGSRICKIGFSKLHLSTRFATIANYTVAFLTVLACIFRIRLVVEPRKS